MRRPLYLGATFISGSPRQSSNREVTAGSSGRRAGGRGRRAHPAVEQRVEDVVGGGLRPPLQDLREEQELQQSTGLGPDHGPGLIATSPECSGGVSASKKGDRIRSVSSGGQSLEFTRGPVGSF